MLVPSGSRLTWVGEFGPLSFWSETSTDAIQNIGAKLKNKYNLIVEAANNATSFLTQGQGTITLTLRTDIDRGNGSDGREDIRGNVSDEFALEASAPIASRITVVTSPGQAPQGTGAPPAPSDPNAPNPANKPCVSVWDCITSGNFSDAYDRATSGLEAGVTGFAIGGIVVVGLVLFLLVKGATD